MRAYTRQLSQAFALAGTHERAMAIRDNTGFFQAVSAQLAKLDPKDGTGGQNEKEKMLLLGFAYLRVEKVDWLSFSFKSLNQKGNEYVNQSSIPYARNLRVSL